ncbi:MAG: type II toxin-antitoxin system PemK/MazF family toxin [Coriobacteriales bacterium]|jgi:mRNA-degrading endonuclease toxin of MazEF toxin-antitoxin module|nr:type II toxin-antitoxin system PemK/MazF family toxin [Coriobacteriales bacterium]
MGEKDYGRWMPVKAGIHNAPHRLIGYKERDIWICSLGENIGFEEDGKGGGFRRPVLVLKIYNKAFCHVVPLSTTDRRGAYYHPFDGHTGKTSVALLSQSRAVDSARLRQKVGYASEGDFAEIKRRLMEILG